MAKVDGSSKAVVLNAYSKEPHIQSTPACSLSPPRGNSAPIEAGIHVKAECDMFRRRGPKRACWHI
jgi:hypothetical protein